MKIEWRRAAFTPATLNEAERTLEAIVSTGADVRRGQFIERLDLAGAEFEDGTPVLDSHQLDVLDRVLGVVEQWRREAGALVARIRLSQRADALLDDIRLGILRAISIGYEVFSWTESRAADGMPVYTARRWKIREVSIVPVGADPGAKIRGKETMTEAAADDTAVVAGKSRVQTDLEIRALCNQVRLGRAWGDAQIAAGVSLEQAQTEALRELAARADEAAAKPPIYPRAPSSTWWTFDNPMTRHEVIADAVFRNRTNAGFDNTPAREYAHVRGLHDLAAQALVASGVQLSARSASDLITRAMGTSDFPLLLAATIGRFLREGYEASPAGILQLAQERLVPDFREVEFVTVAGPGRLERKLEGGEIRYTSLNEESTKGRIYTFASGLVVTREMLTNDDLGAFVTIPQRLGRAAREEEALQAVDLLGQNSGAGPTMADGYALFSSQHGNLHASPGAPDEAHLAAARLAMRLQTDASGRRVGIAPKALLVPPHIEVTVRKLLSSVQAAQTSNVNVFDDLGLIVEPRLASATRYYTVGDGEGLVIARLAGRPAPQVEDDVDFDSKSIRFSVLHDFSCFFIDHRTWYADGAA